jgi:CheY-like chemotaxis protein
MQVLLVEDDEDKREQLSFFLERKIKDVVISKALSLHSGVKALSTSHFDLVILDMSMTTFDRTPTENGGRPQPFGGREIMHQMERKEIATKVVVVTQYDMFNQGDEVTSLYELDKQLRQLFPNLYLGAVHFSVSYSGWQDDLKSLLLTNNII